MPFLIKSTKSLSKTTLDAVNAEVLKMNGQVFLIKENAYDERCLIDKNADFYEKLNIDYECQKADFNKIMIDVTTRCNLKCSVCYRKLNSEADIDFNTLITLSKKFKGKIISICGGEPTLREDLPEIIRMFSRRNAVFLITNGTRLSDSEYLKILKQKGLKYVSFSLNGLSEEMLGIINENHILQDKLMALGNLKRLRIKVVLATVLVRGLNEKELKKLFEFCSANRDFIYELRIRSMSCLGAYLASEKLCMSEMIEIISKELGFDRDSLMKEFELKKITNEIFKKEIFTVKNCSFDFHIKIKRNTFYPILQKFNVNKLSKLPLFLKKPMVIIEILRLFGFAMTIKGILKLIFKKEASPWIHPRNIFKVGIRCWPDIDTIDLNENRRCRTGYWLNGQIVSFCYANILKDKNIQG